MQQPQLFLVPNGVLVNVRLRRTCSMLVKMFRISRPERHPSAAQNRSGSSEFIAWLQTQVVSVLNLSYIPQQHSYNMRSATSPSHR